LHHRQLQVFLWQGVIIAGGHHLVLAIQQIQAACRGIQLAQQVESIEPHIHAQHPRNWPATHTGWLMVSIWPLPAWSIYTGVITRWPCGLTAGSASRQN
jgi:hypothetical protein